MEARYGQITESNKMNQAIYDCFDLLNKKDQKRFVKKFKTQPLSDIQHIHTFSELILGAYLSGYGLIVEYERKIGTQTPDWSILDSSSNITAIVEAVYHHLDIRSEGHIFSQYKVGKKVFAYFPNGNDQYYRRLYDRIQKKATEYENLVTEINVPYVVAVYIDNKAVIDIQATKDCLLGGDESLFKHFPDLSGVLHFSESNRGSYYFGFIENPYALRKIDIPSGYLMKS